MRAQRRSRSENKRLYELLAARSGHSEAVLRKAVLMINKPACEDECAGRIARPGLRVMFFAASGGAIPDADVIEQKVKRRLEEGGMPEAELYDYTALFDDDD